MNHQNVRFRVIKKSAFMSAMRHTNNQVNCKSSVKSASGHQSGQRQVNVRSTSGHPSNQRQINVKSTSNQRQINVKSTSERHPHPKNSKSGERLTPIASDRPAPPGPRLWRGGKRSGNGATKGTSPGGAALGNSPQHGRCHHHAKQETAG